MRPKDVVEQVEFWEEMLVFDGMRQDAEAMRGEAEGGGYDYPGEAYDPGLPSTYGTRTYGKDATLADLSFEDRFPSASRGDVMAAPDELMALGVQYERIEN